MTFRSWIPQVIRYHLSTSAVLQWGHDLSVMDTPIAEPDAAELTPFNGAMTFRSWILVSSGAGGAIRIPSMGP